MTSGSPSNTPPTDAPTECPRCGQEETGRYYGPCGTCRDQLRATYRSEQREVEAPEYEPKMNVTPNAVATKD